MPKPKPPTCAHCGRPELEHHAFVAQPDLEQLVNFKHAILIKHSLTCETARFGLKEEKVNPKWDTQTTTAFIQKARMLEEIMEQCGIPFESIDK